MVAIRTNFFYTRTVPCELWFLDRDKPEEHADKVLMIDARNVYRKVTRKIYDFSREQEKNLLAIVWLYRREQERFIELLADYLKQSLFAAAGAFISEDPLEAPLPDLLEGLEKLDGNFETFLEKQESIEVIGEYRNAFGAVRDGIGAFEKAQSEAINRWSSADHSKMESLKDFSGTTTEPLAEQSRDLIKEIELLHKLTDRLVEHCEQEWEAKEDEDWDHREINRLRKELDGLRMVAVEQLKQVRYLWRQYHWLAERFPEAELRDVKGLVKLVDRKTVEANDWSLTPGRYVGVAPEEEDEDFDFEEAMREIHVELEDLNREAVDLAETIKKNFEELGV